MLLINPFTGKAKLLLNVNAAGYGKAYFAHNIKMANIRRISLTNRVPPSVPGTWGIKSYSATGYAVQFEKTLEAFPPRTDLPLKCE